MMVAGRALVASLAVDGVTTVATQDGTTQIVVAAVTAAGVCGAAFFASWRRRDGGGPSRGETARLRRERDRAIAERDEARELNEQMLTRLLHEDDQK